MNERYFGGARMYPALQLYFDLKKPISKNVERKEKLNFVPSNLCTLGPRKMVSKSHTHIFCLWLMDFFPMIGSKCKNHSTSSRANLHRSNTRIHIYLPFPIQESAYERLPHARAQTSIGSTFRSTSSSTSYSGVSSLPVYGYSKPASTFNYRVSLYRLFRKVYASSN
jgi:hypothetical protein